MSQQFSSETPSPQEQHHHTEIPNEVHQTYTIDSIHTQQAPWMPTDNATHIIRDGYHDADITKQLVEQMPLNANYSTGMEIATVPGDPEDSPDRKRRRLNGDQQVKRHKYDVLKSFFRLYFTVDSQSMVLKDAIFNLYQRKIPPDSRIARNAMYRHMWSFFKEDKISAFQSNYREYIKGIKLIIQPGPVTYDGYNKDIEVFTSIGVLHLFDFQEDELAKTSAEASASMVGVNALPAIPAALVPASAPSPQDFLAKSDISDDEILRAVELMEAQAKALSTSIKELKAKLAARKK